MFEPKGIPSQVVKRKYTRSLASIESARQNGKRSQGPRAPAARQAAAMRALQDGVYAETIILDNENKSEYDALVADFIRGSGAGSPIECAMAEAAALARWRCKRVIRADASALRRQIFDAQCGDQEARDRRVLALAAQLVANPGDTVSRLRETSEGCLWLINQWTIISNMLTVSKLIHHSDCLRAIRLLGRSPSELVRCTDVEDWVRMYMAHYPREEGYTVDLALAHQLFDDCRPSDVTEVEFHERLGYFLDHLSTRQFALDFMRQAIDEALADLFDLFGQREAEEAVRHQTNVGMAQADETIKGARRYRREQALKNEMMTLLAAVKAMRAERLAEAAAAAAAGAPEPAVPGAVADPNPKAQNNPKSPEDDIFNSPLDQEVASTPAEGGNRNGEPAPAALDAGCELDAAGPPGPDPEPPVSEPEPAAPEPEVARPRPKLIDVRDDPPWDQVVRLPAHLAAEFAAAPVAPAEEAGPPEEVPAAGPVPAPAPAPMAAPAPAPIPQPAPGQGGPAAWGPGPHPRDPRSGPGRHVPPHGWPPPPPRGHPPPPPGAGNRFHPRDG